MVKIVLFFILLISNLSFANVIPVTIDCKKISSAGSCLIHSGRGSFLKVNNRKVFFVHSKRNCQKNSCKWVGSINSYHLRIGENNVSFNVTTANPGRGVIYHQIFTINMPGVNNYKINSRKVGGEVDRKKLPVINLELDEIDPVLAREYEEIKRDELEMLRRNDENQYRFEEVENQLNNQWQEITEMEESFQDLLDTGK